MTDLIWNEGMSVGIDVIDEDHKQIIAILAKLTSIHNKQISKQAIEDIFSELEQYVSLHFSREEALLETVCYENITAHKASHQKFIERLPVLKSQWLAEDNLACSDRITTFLHKWIINHILVEDLDYAPALFNSSNFAIQQLSSKEVKPDNNSILTNLSRTLSQKIKLCQRVFITTFIPVVGLFLWSLMVLQESYHRYKNMSLVVSVNDVVMQVNNLSHSLQVERALSLGLINVNSQTFTKQLTERRLITDQLIKQFLTLINVDVELLVGNSILLYSEFARSNFKELGTFRQQLDNKSVHFLQAYKAYTTLIEHLLSITENLIHVEMSSTLANDISVISSVLIFKEYMGQIKVNGLSLINADDVNLQNDIAINVLLGKQLHSLRVFDNIANKHQKELCAASCDKTEYMLLMKQVFSEVMQKQKQTQRSKYWFDFMSAEINKLKVVTDNLTTDFDKTVVAENQRLQFNYLLVFIVLSVFLFAGIFVISILNLSIINPIKSLTSALNGMAKGHRNIQFKNKVIDDEIGAMQHAYEKLRRKLLQVDIFQAIVNSQKKEIEYRKSQQEHFETLAYTDALTGAVNRHQFNAALAEEIARANDERHPLSILLLDIDFFKDVNDNFGHGVGDDVLVKFYKVCKEAARSGDVVARIGGEEFVIILPDSDAKSAYQFAERLRDKIQQLSIIVDDKCIKITVSIGVSQWFNDSFSRAEDFIADADKSLYQAKEQGRNKVVANNLSTVL